MRTTLAIGDFSQATHLSIMTLRHYHRVGLLEPADVDPGTGHRRYTADLEATLARTQEAAASLRDLLQPPAACAPVVIEHRQVPATPAVAVRDTLDLEDATSWFQGALGELHAIAAAQKLTLSGPAGGIYASRLFTHERGEATVYLPCAAGRCPSGRPARRPDFRDKISLN